MKWINKISILLLAFIFMISASGIIIFRTHCTCTDEDHVSLYVTPQTCEKNYHIHHVHDNCEEVPSSAYDCHECKDHMDQCGCNNLHLNYYKLKNEVLLKSARSISLQPLKIMIYVQIPDLFYGIHDKPEETAFYYIEPPSHERSVDFLISVNQLKIPYIA